jgi:hypothetical protein
MIVSIIDIETKDITNPCQEVCTYVKRLDEVDNFYDHSRLYIYLSDIRIMELLQINRLQISKIINPTQEMIDLNNLLSL